MARRRLGELLGGDEGDQLVHAADQWMRGQSIAAPDRMTAVFGPASPD